MPERERPNLDHVRDALREHDRRGDEPDEPTPPESPDEGEEDEGDPPSARG